MNYRTDIPQIVALRSEVEKAAGCKMITHSDFLILVSLIEKKLKEHISEVTLERLWNYSTRKSDTTTSRSLNVLAQFAGYADWGDFCVHLRKNAKVESDFFNVNAVLTSDLRAGDQLRLAWQPDRTIIVRYLGDNRFEAIHTENSSIQPGDSFSCLMFQKNRPLYMDMFCRCHQPQQSASHSRYVVGQDNGLTAVEIIRDGE